MILLNDRTIGIIVSALFSWVLIEVNWSALESVVLITSLDVWIVLNAHIDSKRCSNCETMLEMFVCYVVVCVLLSNQAAHNSHQGLI